MNKYKNILVYILKFIVLILAYTYLYIKFKDIDFSLIPINNNYAYLLLTILLMPVNWLLEARKWQLLVVKFELVSFYNSFKAVLSGLTTSVFTPNRIGEFVGRVMFISSKNRGKATISTLIGSYSQSLVTLILGSISIFFISDGSISVLEKFFYLKWLFLFLSVVLLVLYFNINDVLAFFYRINNNKIKSINYAITTYTFKELFVTVFFSFVRYFVFFLQFYFLFLFFGVELTFIYSLFTISIFYLFLMAIPTFVVSEPGVRVSTSIIVFGFFVNDVSLVIYSVSLLWIINILFPTLAGSVFFINKKVL